MPPPLDGVTVLEFSEIIAGPYGGMLLADMGADVIKIEPPWGEPWRFQDSFIPNESRGFISLNRGKRSLPLDLTRPEARRIVDQLIPDTDVVVINARPDVPYNLGIDWETLSAKNPRLIYCDNTAYGRKGPDSHRPGYDLIVQAMSGLMASEGKIMDGMPRHIVSTPVADYATGIAIAWGVCAALYHRERTGKGQKVETSLMTTALNLQNYRFIQVAAVDDERRAEFADELTRDRADGTAYEKMYERYLERFAPRRHGFQVYYRTYQAKDGVLAVGCLSDRLRKRVSDLVGLDDIRFQPGYDPDSEETAVFNEAMVTKAEKLFREKTVEEWLALFDEAGVPAGPVRFVEELTDDEQVVANGDVVELEHPLAGSLKMVGPLLKMTETPLETRSSSPFLGEHSAEILSRLGYSADDIQRLIDEGITA